jgi:uncharacterized protein (DUF305 family)
MMQNMQSCMGMMHQMTQGRMGGAAGSQMGSGMMGGGMMGGRMGMDARGGSMPGMPPQAVSQSAAAKAYLDAALRMHQPMIVGVVAGDPDEAFVRGMVAHHQGAVDMAKVVLQYGKDPQVRKLAEEIMREQQREIGDMQEWLKKSER